MVANTAKMTLQERQKPSAAAEKSYHDIAQSESDSDSDLDSDTIVPAGKSSTEIAEDDHKILDEEEEREDLLAKNRHGLKGQGVFDVGHGSGVKREIRREKRRAKRRKSRRKGHMKDEEGELMFEMEEGVTKSDTSSEASSSSVELDKMHIEEHRTSKRRRRFLCAGITSTIIIFFAIITLGAYKVSHDHDAPYHLGILSNGTTDFAPTTILISLDGFRADFLQRGRSPTLKRFIAEGVSPRWMLPSFPSLTFPNHYTLVTGLYPESHGIVGNTFWDPETRKEFHYTDPTRSMQPYWWAEGEPLWVTAEKQGVRTAVHMWPGSEAGMDFSATYLDKYNGSEILPRKTQRILELLDRPFTQDKATTRPQLIAAYVPNVDADGHKYGPNSTDVWDTIADVDDMLHDMFLGLSERNLTNIVNVVIVSDHGMATVSTERMIQLEDMVDLDLIDHIDGWPHYGLRTKESGDLQGVHDRLVAGAKNNGHFDVYLRDHDMPPRYHFSQNDRIAPLWMMPHTGWAIVTKDEFDIAKAKETGEQYSLKGMHGYDFEDPLMRAIFIARGPAFPHKPNSRLENFQNIEIYNIICDSIGITPKPNNGTLRLPLHPIGLHNDLPYPETPADPPTSPASVSEPTTVPTKDDSKAEVETDKALPSATSTKAETEASPSPSTSPEAAEIPEEDSEHSEEEEEDKNAPENDDEDPDQDEDKNKEVQDLWTYWKAKWAAAVKWAHGVLEGVKGKTDKGGATNDGG